MTFLAFARHMLFCLGLAMVSALVVRAMMDARVMDVPDARKAHGTPVPKGGGVGIVTAFLLGISVLYGFADFARIADPYFRGVILAAAAIAAVSFADDVRDFPFIVKLAAQVLAALAAIGSGLVVRSLNLPLAGPVPLGLLAVPATLGWLLFATNAMNFIDGMNGLAAGTSLVAALFLAAIGWSQKADFVYFSGLLLAAGIAGFLPFNFPRARIFMGDVGSQFCGFMLAVLGVVAARFERVDLSFLIVPMLLNGVLYDVAFTLVRRILAGESPARAHRGHLYQVAARAGMDPRFVAVLHWMFAALGGIASIGFVAAPTALRPLLPPLLLVPQLVWTSVVVRAARRGGIGRW
jgi:UDP-GlcNAc:undecaprenyl-phosphate/decaprenyl-phosphate GlcNAc-1-phosphate transferase